MNQEVLQAFYDDNSISSAQKQFVLIKFHSHNFFSEIEKNMMK